MGGARTAALGLALVAAVAARAEAAVVVRDPGCATVALPMRSDQLLYRLPWGFLLAGTDSAWTRVAPLERERDYVIDRVRGELRLLRAPVPGETLWVAACRLLDPPPTELQLTPYRRTPPDSAADSTRAPAARPEARPATSRNPSKAPSGAALSVTGNKTLAVEFGSSQDAFLRQSLDLAVSGTLAPGVALTGVLSDRNLPVTAGGSTRDLQSLDRVLIELSSPHGTASLGDVGLTLDQGEFGRVDRRLQGMSGSWNLGPASGTVAVANAQGEYNRMQFFGVDGLQGPYQLTDRDGNPGIGVVAGSEIVTVDGARMTRGEGADYSIDYERARITFSNRRPITSVTRITVEYQFSLNRYRRNLAAAGARWSRGAVSLFSEVVTEGDDKGSPLDLTLDASDRLALQLAGDSTRLAVGVGVSPGPGDYDTVRVAGNSVVFAYAGHDSGAFAVQFSPVGAGRGDYADSAVVDGRTVYRWVGGGQGAYQIGRQLPLPESHQLWTVGGGGHAGPMALELEGAVSKHDLNTFSSRDDGDNLGTALRGKLSVGGAVAGALGGKAGLAVEARTVDRRFAPFQRLERPFAQEDWGLPVSSNFESQRKLELTGFLEPRAGGRLVAELGRLETPDGFRALRRSVSWSRVAVVTTRASWERAEGRDDARAFPDGGRDHWRVELGLRLPWIEPAARLESDDRRSPSDSARIGERFREAAVELRSPSALAWRAVAGLSRRRDATAAAAGGYVDLSETRTLRLGLDSPSGTPLGASLAWQRRRVTALAAIPGASSDLASAKLRLDDAARGLEGRLDVEITSEGTNPRRRTLVFVGNGAGAYDAFGNYVGTGDYDLVVTVSPTLERVARAATSAHATWRFGHGEAWEGSRLAFTFESDAQRRGGLSGWDAALSPGAALDDPGLARGAVTQRLESDLAPGSASGALQLRLERRVTGDRTYLDFAQTLDDRTATVRWRTRPAPSFTTELEGSFERQAAGQRLAAGAGYARVLTDQVGSGKLVWTPDARLRLVGAVETRWSRPDDRTAATRTVRVGPDLGLAVGSRGRLELTARRAFVTGPPAVGLLPSADPAGAPRWEGSGRLDVRVHDTTTAGVSMTLRERQGRGTETTGRAELRAFF